jgi:lipoprotein-anchoring transpeptidase ErfK/SrfK
VLLQGLGTAGCRNTNAASDRSNLRTSGLVLAIAVLAASVAWPTDAEAAKKNSNSGWSFFGYSAYDYSPRQYKPKPRAPRKATPRTDEEAIAEKIAPYKADGKPLFLMVSLAKQRISVFDASGRVADAPISSGRIGFSTPTGVFSILQKNRVHFSNLYDSAPMPNMQRLTWSGVALHAGDLPGYPASHGCIRLPRNFSKQLFDMTKMGTRVVVTRDPIEPAPIAHAKLFGSFPPDAGDAPVSGAAENAAASESLDAPEATVQTASADGTNPAAMTQAINISTADTAPSHATLPARPESPMRAKRKAERAEAEAAVEAAKAEKTKLQDEAKAAVAAADAVKLELRNANVAATKLRNAIRKAEADRDEGDKQLAAFFRKFAGTAPLTDEQRTASIEEEKALEANALALADAVDAARAEADKAEQAALDVEAKLADLDHKRREAINALTESGARLRQAGAKISAIRTAEALRNYPASVYISRKTGKLYVRQNQKPILEVPVTFTSPDQPLGTHIYTALDYVNDEKTELAWNAISIPASAPKDTRTRLEKLKAKVEADKMGVPAPTPATRQTPQAALERVAIDDSTREQIVDIMKPGSSVIITDHGISNETGQYTDFIVLTNQ